MIGRRANEMPRWAVPSIAIENLEGTRDESMKLFDFRTRFGHVAAALLLAVMAVGCGDYSGSDTDTSILSNNLGGASLPQGLSVTEQVTSFETTVYPVLRANCENCHGGSGPGAPQIAHPDSATAWSATVDNQKVNFSDPAASRLVRRLASDFHHCWSDCATDAGVMLNEIIAWQQAIEAAGGTTGGVDVSNLTSNTRLRSNEVVSVTTTDDE